MGIGAAEPVVVRVGMLVEAVGEAVGKVVGKVLQEKVERLV